jgi:hypothetical protein
MNDNLRYISLQYIKGNNYDKVTCFSFGVDELQEFLDDSNRTDTDTFLSLEKTDKNKCEIGESLLDDLINYIEFKELISLFDKEIKGVETKRTEKEENKKAEEDKYISDNKKIKKIFYELTKLVKKIKNKKDVTDDDVKKFNDVVNNLIKLIKVGSQSQHSSTKNPQRLQEGQTKLQELINDNTKKDEIIYELNFLKKSIILSIEEELNLLKTENLLKKKLICVDKILRYFNLIYEILSDENKEKEASKKIAKGNSDKLIKLYSKYIYICKNNIKKYEKIFEYNEIDNIDDAFMIESYSKFLKKLKKIKESLESKDMGKIERNLIHFLDKFFNLHGFNNPDKIEEQTDLDYLVQRIINYT